MWKEIKRIIQAREIIAYLIDQEQKVQHRDKLLGNIWMLLTPLLMSLVLFVDFKYVRHAKTIYYLYIFTGLLSWEIVNKSLNGCSFILRNRKGLIQKFPLPLGIFPTAIILHKVHDLIFGLIAYGIIFFAIKFISEPDLTLSPMLLLLPVWAFFFMMLLLGFGLILARIGVYFADLRDILDILLRAGFFLNPVFLDVHVYPQKAMPLYFLLNPLAGYLMYFRHVMPGGKALLGYYEIPVPYYPLYLGILTIAVFLFGLWFFQNGIRHYAKYI